jgi:hypothetical protein
MEWVAVAILLLLFLASRGKNGLLQRAADGKKVDEDKVAAAYWALYGRTYRPKSRWIMMSREQKSDIYRERERLEALLAAFPDTLQQKVMQARPGRDW